jgi:hypothetical protein
VTARSAKKEPIGTTPESITRTVPLSDQRALSARSTIITR